jgi:hypothetical protein
MADPTASRITTTLAESIRAGELGDTTVGMPGAWVLVGVYHDAEGDERAMFLTPDGQPLRETLGLLDSGQTVWREQLARWVLGPHDDTG